MSRSTHLEELEIDADEDAAIDRIPANLDSVGIRYSGFSPYREGGRRRARLVTDDPRRTRRVLEDAGFRVETAQTLRVVRPV